MKDEILFDYRQYIQDRLREIDDLEERRYAKQILLDGLANIFDISEERYRQLGERISKELEVPWNRYEIVTTVTELSQYDPIHETLFPICMEDISAGRNRADDNSRDGNKGLKTVYLAADDTVCRDFLEEGTITGTLDGQEILYRISRSRRYGEAIEKIYRLFLSNQIPWRTVHIGYVERFFDLEPLEKNIWEDGKDTDANVVFHWGRWEPYIRNDKIPLWNIKESTLESHKFALPCLDGTCYEHTFVVNDKGEGTFLIDTRDDIMEIRQEQNAVILKSKTKVLKQLDAYRLYSTISMGELTLPYFPALSNWKSGSFTGKYLNKNGNFLLTGAELFRKVNELSGRFSVNLARYEIQEKIAASVLHADMNPFLGEGVFSGEKRRLLVFYFQADKDGYLNQAHIRYILSQLQMEYMEYKCIGIME